MKAIKEKPTVLIVDDAPENLQVLGQALSDHYEVVMATGGSEALRIAFSPVQPDLILLDVIMPDIDGYQVCRELKTNEATRDIPIIFITIRDDEDGETQGLELGAIDYIKKPFSVPIVRSRVKNHIDLIRNKELAEASVRQREEFLTSLSHEIRNPLHAILGTVDLLSDTEMTDYQREQVEVLKSEGEFLTALLDDILDLSRIEAGMLLLEENDFSLRDLLAETLHGRQVQAQEKNLRVRSHVHENVPERLRGDDHRLRQILMNLVDNAIKFTEEGEIVVHVDLEEAVRDRLQIHFTVSDTGIGISSEDLKNIFTRFARAEGLRKHGRRGSGIGLDISRRLTEAMGGTIWAKSEPGKGSDFHFTIRVRPARATNHRRLQNKGLLPPQCTLEGCSVLFVDDNPVNQGMAKAILGSLGCNFQVVSNGAEALRALSTHEFHIVLMDVQMPEVDGMQATRIIREREASQPTERVIIIGQSGNSSAEYRQICLTSGMDDYIVKPIRKESLQKKLQGWLVERSK